MISSQLGRTILGPGESTSPYEHRASPLADGGYSQLMDALDLMLDEAGADDDRRAD